MSGMDVSHSSVFSPQLDNSSGSLLANPFGNTYRGIGSSWFNAENIAREDWVRDMQSQYNSYLMSMSQMSAQNKFNAEEAQKARDFEERLSNTAYQRAVEDMKSAGINPVIAYGSGASGASTPSGSAASSGSGGSYSGYRSSGNRDPLMSLLAAIGQAIVAGVTKNPKAIAKAQLAKESALLSKKMSYVKHANVYKGHKTEYFE